MVDYQRFYSRSFQEVERTTRRIHFFKSDFDRSTFEGLLAGGKINEEQTKQLGYLGFTVIKPIRNKHKELLIGKTLVRPPYEENQSHRFVKMLHPVSLFGIDLSIDAVPFQAQDHIVGACATTALWTAIAPMSRREGLKEYSPSEITEISNSLPGQQRIFPNNGLSLPQMLTFLRLADSQLDVEVISSPGATMISTAVKAYIYGNFPLIATLGLYPDDSLRPDLHAAVIVGYRSGSEGELESLFVHDDQLSPYAATTGGAPSSFETWQNGWNRLRYREIRVRELVIPVYHKVRTSFVPMNRYFEKYQEKEKAGRSGLRMELYLTTVQRYKQELWAENVRDKTTILSQFLPRFLWIIRSFSGNERLVDVIFDGTSPVPKRMLEVRYT